MVTTVATIVVVCLARQYYCNDAVWVGPYAVHLCIIIENCLIIEFVLRRDVRPARALHCYDLYYVRPCIAGIAGQTRAMLQYKISKYLVLR